ncbi:MAG: PIN domain-containing protein [Acidobacteria bacterium]|nr:PIN domain-containing protein [Acidobacteriota bacterium]
MTPHLFVDTDVVLDLLARREPFYPAAARLFSQAERGLLHLSVSALCFSHLFYILRKELSAPGALEVLRKLLRLVSILPVDEGVIRKALEGDFADFEDAIQHETALAGGAERIVTRNVKGYRGARLPVVTPEDLTLNSA